MCFTHESGNYLVATYALASSKLVWSMPGRRLYEASAIGKTRGSLVSFRLELVRCSSHRIIYGIKESSAPQVVLAVACGALINDDCFLSRKHVVEMQNNFSNALIVSLQFYSNVGEWPNPSFLHLKESEGGHWRPSENSFMHVKYLLFYLGDCPRP